MNRRDTQHYIYHFVLYCRGFCTAVFPFSNITVLVLEATPSQVASSADIAVHMVTDFLNHNADIDILALICAPCNNIFVQVARNKMPMHKSDRISLIQFQLNKKIFFVHNNTEVNRLHRNWAQ